MVGNDKSVSFAQIAAALKAADSDLAFVDAIRPFANRVHLLLSKRGAREIFRYHRERESLRRDWSFPGSAEYRKVHGDDIPVTDKYIWLGTIHDLCWRNESVFPGDEANQPSFKGIPLLAGSIAVDVRFDPEGNLRMLEGFLADVEANLAVNPSPPAGTAGKPAAFSWRRFLAAVVVSAFLIPGFEGLVYGLPWNWLKNHPNSYAIQGGTNVIILLLSFAYFIPKWRRWCLATGSSDLFLSCSLCLAGQLPARELPRRGPLDPKDFAAPFRRAYDVSHYW